MENLTDWYSLSASKYLAGATIWLVMSGTFGIETERIKTINLGAFDSTYLYGGVIILGVVCLCVSAYAIMTPSVVLSEVLALLPFSIAAGAHIAIKETRMPVKAF